MHLIYRLTPQVLLLGAFGPYLVANFGIRTEQLLAYSLFIIFLPKIISPSRFSIRLDRSTFLIALIWISISMITLTTTFSAFYTPYRPTPGQLLAGTDNQLMCLCVILTVGTWQFRQRKTSFLVRDNLSNCALFLGYLLLANTILAICQAMALNVNSFLAYFWTSSLSEEYGISVASRVLSGRNRFTGIFNQPFECGLLYSIGLLLCVYRHKILKTLDLANMVVLAGIIVGGFIGLSKVFILGGIPLSTAYFLGRVKSVAFLKKFLFLVALGIFLLVVLLNINEKAWQGASAIKLLFRLAADSAQDRSALELYSAGRYGGERNYIAHAFAKIWEISPFFGVGFGNIGVVLDNAYIVMYKQGGFPALFQYIWFIASLLYFSYKRSFVKFFPEKY